ncbi:coproporphyrinogen III oxidase, partial [Candidatus Aquarickettsia rohweri]
YFYLPHRKEPRGVGGIFYDYLNSGNWEKDFEFTKEIGVQFKKAFFSIIKRNIMKKWTKVEKSMQLEKRGRYVEFNLLYDRGTKFGLMTNGNTEAILMSMPPMATW